MQQYVGAVVASRIELKQLAIQSVREPGHRMPIGLIVGGESPRYRVPSETCLNVEVVRDIAIVVVIDERMLNRRIVKNDGCDHEDKTQNKDLLLRSSEPFRSGVGGSPLLRFAKMPGFHASRSHSSPVFDEYIRWRPSFCDRKSPG